MEGGSGEGGGKRIRGNGGKGKGGGGGGKGGKGENTEHKKIRRGKGKGKGKGSGCYTCGEEGHRASECPNKAVNTPQPPPPPPRQNQGKGKRQGGGGGGGGGNGNNHQLLEEVVPIPQVHARKANAAAQPMTATQTKGPSVDAAHLFEALQISSLTKRAISDVLQYSCMTPVQVGTIPIISQGVDVMAKAKTGTGKTLAFLIPTIEVITTGQQQQMRQQSRDAISVLVMSPTRELASQICSEAHKLITYHKDLKASVVFGGVPIKKDYNKFINCDILVATPGRLIDHLDNTNGFSTKLSKISVLIFDEADQMLDMGFRPAIEKILRSLPPREKRQTLLFSATIPQALKQICSLQLRPNFQLVDTVGSEVGSDQVHHHVHQELVVVSLEQQLPVLISLLLQKCAQPHKIIVFFATAKNTAFVAEFWNAMGRSCVEIHSRKSQSFRDKASKMFHDNTNLILFTSDVTARGLDYPDVTSVIQIGLTSKEQYIHRLGRTARAGRDGDGMLLLMDFEQQAMQKELKGLPLEVSAQQPLVDTFAQEVFQSQPYQQALACASNPKHPLNNTAMQSYQAWLGFYNSNLKKLHWTPQVLVAHANNMAKCWGYPHQPPALQKKTIGKMGLKGVQGLNTY
eukprot:CAMPEP_0114352438 /NCGR_PEP_ID=MMETSP0101-20121206/17954_1 /TAXON_ID=38822 ORGANISM="Pteridomonas danica, Strain PT" /NCGR_SAMPLE_ID=MMETSP0101 /ASSEMBLY_ACC=CAM_ASM_000211 /LENGTH=628 /DNA_ID=CAMNT_0001492855 /DNA_START=54 /DNA_END=1940 /DNA_ORIENTATION=+